MGWMSAIVIPTKRRCAWNYYITQWRQEVRQFGDQTRWSQDAVEKAGTQKSGPPGPRLSSPGERERNAVMVNRVGVNMLQFCSVSNSPSHTTLSIKWEVYFSKRLCRASLLCRRYDFACIRIWVYNTRSRYISFFPFYFSLFCAKPERHSPLFSRFSFCWLSEVLLVWLRLGDPFVSHSPREVCASQFLERILGCSYTICSYGQI